MTTAIEIDGVELSDAIDFARLVREGLTFALGSLYKSDVWPLDSLLRFYEKVKGTPYAGRFTRGVAACLTDGDPVVRAQALMFFESHPQADGADAVNDIMMGAKRALFHGVSDPIHEGIELDWQLLRTLGARLDAGDSQALQVARMEVLRPGKAEPVAAALTSSDPDWVIDNVEAIVRKNHDAISPILFQLKKTRRPWIPVAERIAAVGVDARTYWKEIDSVTDDAAVRDRLRKLVPLRS